MDWTQIALALIVGTPAIIAAIGSFINTVHLLRLKEQTTAVGNSVKKEAATIKEQNVELRNDTTDQTVKIDQIGEKAVKIAKAVNGDLESRFTTIEGKVDTIGGQINSLVNAMMEAKLLKEHPINPKRPPSERG